MTDDKKKLFQVIGGGLIIACAFAIMMPGFISYLFGLWRIFALIAMIIVITVSVVFVYHKLIKSKTDASKDNIEAKPED